MMMMADLYAAFR